MKCLTYLIGIMYLLMVVSSNALSNNLPVMIITGDVSQLENTTNKNLPITVKCSLYK